MKKYRDSQLDFTDRGWNTLYEVVDDPAFKTQSAESIYLNLIHQCRPVPFCDYLKRFLYRAASLEGDFRTIPTETYQGILRAAFRETHTPASFEEGSTKLSAASANWLSQRKASRATVLLLGFGLSLSLAEVNEFLLKGLHTEALRRTDPRELLCAYCYDYGYTFPKFEKLQKRYEAADWSAPADEEEAALFQACRALREKEQTSDSPRFEVFMSLYEQVRILLAKGYEPDEWKQEPARPEDFSPADLEAALYEGIPRDAYDNLLPMKRSALYAVFGEGRLSRKRLFSLLHRQTLPERRDLITLNFYLWSQKEKDRLSPRKRFTAFTEDTNRLLSACGFGELYAAIPYECFLMMCLLTNDPLAVYTDVWERSYQE